jgi:tetratricopeptide (TPR) repeat protein
VQVTPDPQRAIFDASSKRGAGIFWGCAAALCSLVAFWPILGHQFVNWDDDKLILNNEHFRGLGPKQLEWMFTTFLMGHYEPITWLSYGVDYLMWGLAPRGYHLTNLFWHVLNALVFLALSRRLLKHAGFGSGSESSCWVAAGLSAIVFAVHPLRVESVAWVSERRDVLSGFFYLAALFCYVRFVEGSKKGGHSRGWFGVSMAAYALSLLSKPTAIGLPVILVLLDWYPLRRFDDRMRKSDDGMRGLAWEKVPFVLLALGGAICAVVAQRHGDTLASLAEHSVASRLLSFGYGLSFYVLKSLIPFHLSPLVPMPSRLAAGQAALAIAGALGIGAVLGVGWRYRKARPAVVVAASYVLLLLPVAGLAQIGPQLVADRYSYLSCMGLSIALGALLAACWAWAHAFDRGLGSVAVVLGIVVLGLLCIRTRSQVAVWRDSESLWTHVLREFPNSEIAHVNLANVLAESGQLERADRHFRAAIALRPSMSQAHYGLGMTSHELGDLRGSIASFRRVLELRPDDVDAWNNLGGAQLESGDAASAVQSLRRVAELLPESAKIQYNLGSAEAAAGDEVAAVRAWRRALALALDSRQILETLAWHLATSGDESLRDGPEALRLANRALQLGGARDANSWDVLAAAQAELGQWTDAVHSAERAVGLAKAQSVPGKAVEIEARLREYRVERPYRMPDSRLDK